MLVFSRKADDGQAHADQPPEHAFWRLRWWFARDEANGHDCGRHRFGRSGCYAVLDCGGGGRCSAALRSGDSSAISQARVQPPQ